MIVLHNIGLGPDLQRIVSHNYELLMISGTYDKLKTKL